MGGAEAMTTYSVTPKTEAQGVACPAGDVEISQVPTATGDGVLLVSGSVDRDAWELARAGKKQVLERRFGLASMVGLSCSIMITWESTILFFNFGLANGGPAGLIWGFLICWVGTTSVFISMGELASMLPTAGGQYYWASILAPPQYSRFLSYLTGWVTITAWIAGLALTSIATALVLQVLIQVNHSSYEGHPWQALLIMYAALLLALILNNWLGALLPIIEVLILAIHIIGFFAVLIPLLVVGDVSNSGHIFTTFFNEGKWPTQALSVFIGLYGNATSFLGTDGAIHMSEEISRSSVNTPRSMLLAITINGTLGFIILIVFLLVAGNLEALLAANSQFPYILILQRALGSTGGVTVLVSLLTAMEFFCTIALLSSASRMMWSFAREQAMPGWRWLRAVDRRTSIPTHATYVIVVACALLGLIDLGSSTAFNALTSLVLEGFCMSYLVAISLLLYRRLRGDIKDERVGEIRVKHRASDHEDATRPELVWGPWRIKGFLGTLNNIFAIIYLVIIMFFSFWPGAVDPTVSNMNWSVAVLGGVSILSIVYYFIWAKKEYIGPRIEVEIVKM